MNPTTSRSHSNQPVPAVAPISRRSRSGLTRAAVTRSEQRPRKGGDDGTELSEAGGALFPWHTDLAANGEITAIATLLAPATLEFAPHADHPGVPTTIDAMPGSLVLLSGEARWEWVHRALPHPGAAGKERISLVLGCAPTALPHPMRHPSNGNA